MGSMSGRKLDIYIFCSFCSSFEPLDTHRISSTRNGILSDIHFRLLEYISTTRYSSKFRVLGEKTPIESILSTSRTYFNHSKRIEVSTIQLKKNILGGYFRIFQ